MANKAVEYITWYLKLDDSRFSVSTREFEYHWALLNEEVKLMKKYNSPLVKTFEPKVEQSYNLYLGRLKK